MVGDLEVAAAPFGVDPVTAVRWGQQLAYGLERIHAEGLLHRDVKPGNAYCDGDGDVLLGDLGMAIRTDATGCAAADGTLATVAPEVLQNGLCCISTDVYSLGATVFYLLSSQYPNGAKDLDKSQRRDRINARQFDKLREVAPHVSQSLGQIVERSLSADPALRPSSAQEFANQLAHSSHHRRTWRRIAAHPGHDHCLEGSAAASAMAVTVCVILGGRGRASIEVQLATGRHLRQHEQHDVVQSKVPGVLRAVTRKL